MARALWKAVLEIADLELPVKLYSGVIDRSVRFRLLHAPDLTPVEQRMVNPVTGKVVPTDRMRRGVQTEEGIVILDPDELAQLEPRPSRSIEVLQFVPPETIDHRWYLQPYWLGPDGSEARYVGLARELAKTGLEGVARWTMRKQRYRGALRVRQGRLLLVTLRSREEVVSLAELERPPGRLLGDKERVLAERLVGTLADGFQPERYRDEYRDRVLELIEAKASGKTIPLHRPRPRRREESLTKALEASLARARERSVA